MKPKQKHAKAKTSGIKKPAAEMEAIAQAVTTVRADPSDGPDPGALLVEAEQEPDRWLLCDYEGVIDTLREKHLSFREIAEWLSARGVQVDHNAVYRTYTKRMSEQETASEQAQDDYLERDVRGEV